MLLPGSEVHWLIETLALMNSESVVFSDDTEYALENTRVEELHGMVRRLDWLRQAACVCLAQDFDDFNILHDHEAMAKDYRRLGMRILRHMNVDTTALRSTVNTKTPLAVISGLCALLAADGLSQLYARDLCGDGELQEYTHLIRGLWTGWRSTMWYNTRFDHAYSKVVVNNVCKYYGFEQQSLESYYIGDDSAALAKGWY